MYYLWKCFYSQSVKLRINLKNYILNLDTIMRNFDKCSYINLKKSVLKPAFINEGLEKIFAT